MTLTIEPVPHDEPLLETSPLIRAVLRTAEYIETYGSIGLTRSGAFNRRFVHWAAAHFDWPGYSEENLFRMNKVLNAIDFPPLCDIHTLLEETGLGRKRKGEFRLTRAGKTMIAHRGRLLSELVPNYLFRIDHGEHLRFPYAIPGNWEIFLNVINVEAEHGMQLADLRRSLYGTPTPTTFDEAAWALYVSVVAPLCWSGLLVTDRPGRYDEDAHYMKSELWRRYLRLHTDGFRRQRVLH